MKKIDAGIIFTLLFFYFFSFFLDGMMLDMVNIFSSFLFFTHVTKIYISNFNSFLRNIFVNTTLVLSILGALAIDVAPKMYIVEISKYTEATNTTTLLAFYFVLISSIMNNWTFKSNFLNPPRFLHNNLLGNLFEMLAIFCIVYSGYLVFSNGVAIFLGMSRIEFYNSLADEARAVFVYVNIATFYLGYRYYLLKYRRYILLLVLILIIRILAGQKYTELFIALGLFFSFNVHGSFSSNSIKLKVAFPVAILGVFLLSSLSYNGDYNKVTSRVAAQSQLAFYVNKEYSQIYPRLDELAAEYKNFSGSNDLRLQLFENGDYYGVFKLMDLSDTGRDLLLQAQTFTSASGTIPIIYVYYYGIILSIPIMIIITLMLTMMMNFLISLCLMTQNPLIVCVASLLIIRILKFYVIGAPSHIFNDQFLVYGLAIFATAYVPKLFPTARVIY